MGSSPSLGDSLWTPKDRDTDASLSAAGKRAKSTFDATDKALRAERCFAPKSRPRDKTLLARYKPPFVPCTFATSLACRAPRSRLARLFDDANRSLLSRPRPVRKRLFLSMQAHCDDLVRLKSTPLGLSKPHLRDPTGAAMFLRSPQHTRTVGIATKS